MPTNIRTCPIHGGYATACGCTNEQMDAALRSALPPKGCLDILNAGSGHIEIRYDTNDTAEIERAKKIIEDMIKRGYSLFIEGEGGALTRVESFDAKNGAYIIADKGKKRRPHGVKVPMAKARVTAIGRTAGG